MSTYDRTLRREGKRGSPGALAALFAGVAMLVAATPANAFVPMPSLETNGTVEVAARKGTRNYRPDGATPATAGTERTTSPLDAMKLCMETWDEATHISRAKWREICQRQLNDRDSMRTP